jgi:flagellar motor switch protein FliG
LTEPQVRESWPASHPPTVPGQDQAQRIRESIASQRPPESSTHATRPPLTFDDLVYLGDDDLLRTFQAVSQEVLALALAGASDELLQRIWKTMPRREAKRIKRSLRLEYPTRLDDIESAKRQVAEIAAELIEA